MILITLRRFPVIILFSFFNLVRDTSTLYYEGIHQIGRCARFTQIVISEAPAIEPRQAPFPAGGLNHRTVVAFVCLVLAISNSICFPFCTYQFIALWSAPAHHAFSPNCCSSLLPHLHIQIGSPSGAFHDVHIIISRIYTLRICSMNRPTWISAAHCGKCPLAGGFNFRSSLQI
jgi:hypothetical protein